MLYLVLALLWLIVGAALLVSQATAEGAQGRASVMAMLFALLMTVWNLSRWYMIQRRRWRRRAAVQAENARLTQNVRRSEPLPEPDPAFDFTSSDPPPIRSADGPAPRE